MNIDYKRVTDEKEMLKALELWNLEMGLIYPITLKSFRQNVINYSTKEVYIASVSGELVGFIIIKLFNDELLPSYNDTVFISLFYVKKKMRYKGIGTKLFDYVENKYKGKTIQIGKDINNFFPAIPTEFDNLTDVWLEKRGYTGERYTHDLISYNPIPYEITNKNFKFCVCEKNDASKLIAFLIKNNWNRWAYEAKCYYENDPDSKSYLVCFDNNEIIGFVKINTDEMKDVSYNIMWSKRFSSLGGIGPLGVSREYRNIHLGQDMISFAITSLKKRAKKEMMIDWTGLMELYSKFGFEVWKSYKYMSKNN